MSETMRACGVGPMGMPSAWEVVVYASDGYTEKALVVAPTPEDATAKVREIYAKEVIRGRPPVSIVSVEKTDYLYVIIG